MSAYRSFNGDQRRRVWEFVEDFSSEEAITRH
jgi:hypothetical protein